jgi:hypothetical protein
MTTYAILSHTWGADTEEVTFKDMMDGTGITKAGYSKIRFCGEQARRDDLQYLLHYIDSLPTTTPYEKGGICRRKWRQNVVIAS